MFCVYLPWLLFSEFHLLFGWYCKTSTPPVYILWLLSQYSHSRSFLLSTQIILNFLLERKKRPKSQELSPTEAFARKELPSSMNLTRPAVDGCWRSTTADGWELGDELEKQKTHSAISGLTGHKQGQVVTWVGDWGNAAVVGKCSFNSDFFFTEISC